MVRGRARGGKGTLCPPPPTPQIAPLGPPPPTDPPGAPPPPAPPIPPPHSPSLNPPSQIPPPPPPQGASGQQLVGGVVGIQNRGVPPPPWFLGPMQCVKSGIYLASAVHSKHLVRVLAARPRMSLSPCCSLTTSHDGQLLVPVRFPRFPCCLQQNRPCFCPRTKQHGLRGHFAHSWAPKPASVK